MREIIGNKTYDTEVSTHILTIGNESEDGDMLDKFRLYQDSEGEYFFWVSDQTGPDWIETCSYDEAVRLLNTYVETHSVSLR